MGHLISTARRNAATDSVVDALDAGAGAGKLRLYTGTQPASPNSSATGTLLVEFTLNDPAFGSASSGFCFAVLPGGFIAATAAASGQAGWFRGLDSNNVAVVDGGLTDIDYWQQFGSGAPPSPIVAGTTVRLRNWSFGTDPDITRFGAVGITPAVAAQIQQTVRIETSMEVLSATPAEAAIAMVVLPRMRATVFTPAAAAEFEQAPRAPGTGGLARFPQPAYDPDRPGAVPPVQYRPGGVDYEDGQDV